MLLSSQVIGAAEGMQAVGDTLLAAGEGAIDETLLTGGLGEVELTGVDEAGGESVRGAEGGAFFEGCSSEGLRGLEGDVLGD